jgi:putative ubiquitin-RnfH superfamily antitoxin RatB of RatAB toxin-antitoxin module
MGDQDIEVQVCYARPGKYFLCSLRVAPGTTLQAALEASGLLDEVPDIDVQTCRVGVYGKLKTLDTPLRAQDRVEIYRPLIADPKESRRRRAVKKAV